MNKEIKNFFDWTKKKIRLHFKPLAVYFHNREVWWASLGVNIGYEQDGKNEEFERPILILKKFNKDMLWILPMTSQNRSNEFYHQVEYQNQKYAVILSQLRLISSKRLLRKIRTISKGEFKEIKEKIKSFL